jgi:AhpD family alkylhydroperoxidase
VPNLGSTTPRIRPRPPTEWPAAMDDALAAFRPAARGTSPASPAQPRRNPGNLLATFACYPELAKAYLTFNGHVLFSSSLPARAREILILRVAARRRCEYEWAQHVRLATAAGLTAEEIGRIAEGPERPEWDTSDRSLLRGVDELVDGAQISDATWTDLERHFDERQLMDLVFTVGAYETLAMALRSFRVESDIELTPNLPATTGVWDGHAVQSNEGTT